MQALINLIETNEDWLIRRVLQYAQKRGYTRYTSTLEEAWRLSIAGLSASLVQGLSFYSGIPDFGPEDNFVTDPLNAFGVIEAQRHRKRGVSLAMFLGLLKYYRQSYMDLVAEHVSDPCQCRHSQLFLSRSFDRMEIAFCQEWAGQETEMLMAELQETNRLMTNEKNTYLTFFESLSDPALILNNRFEILNLNHAAAAILHPQIAPGAYYYSAPTAVPSSEPDAAELRNQEPALIGKNILQVFPWLAGVLEHFQTSMERIATLECTVQVGETPQYFEVRYARMMDVSAKNATIIFILRNISDRKQMEIELKKSNRELDDFAYIASHDLKEPLRAISNYSLFLMEDYGDKLNGEARSRIETVIRLCKREEDLINSLLHFSRLGRTDLDCRPMDLNALLQDIRQTLQHLFPQEKIRLHIPEPLPPAVGDEIRVREIFLNLIINGIKYNLQPEKIIEVGTRKNASAAETGIVFYVKDNGIGIPEKHRDKIFTLFKRLHGRDKYGGGAGAGLTIVKKIVERHGGTIWVDSVPDQGTTFFFTLPGGAGRCFSGIKEDSLWK